MKNHDSQSEPMRCRKEKRVVNETRLWKNEAKNKCVSTTKKEINLFLIGFTFKLLLFRLGFSVRFTFRTSERYGITAALGNSCMLLSLIHFVNGEGFFLYFRDDEHQRRVESIETRLT